MRIFIICPSYRISGSCASGVSLEGSGIDSILANLDFIRTESAWRGNGKVWGNLLVRERERGKSKVRVRHVLGFSGRITTDPERQPLSGIGNAAIHIAAAQRALGHQVAVFGFSDPFPPGNTTWQDVGIVTMKRWRWAHLASLDASLLLPMLWQTMQQPHVDVLHIHVELGLLYLPRACVRIIHLHGVLGAPVASYRHLLNRVDGVICCSEYIRDAFLTASGYSARRTLVVHNGAAFNSIPNSEAGRIRQQLNLAPEDVGILFVGALVPAKGVHVLLEAIQRLQITQADDGKKIKTIVVGGSSLWRHMPNASKIASAYETRLHATACRLNVTFLGLMPHKEVQRLYQACDILVLPSIVQEGHPLVICEAMAAGKPVIASQVGGIPETVVNGKTGILVPPGDAEALASAIHRLVEDRNLREQMGHAARQRSRLFTWEAAARKLQQIYQMLLEERTRQ